MKKGLTLIVMILDASGSMAGRTQDVIGSIKDTIKTNRELPGEAVFSIFSFDNSVRTLVDYKNVNEIENVDYRCNGMTALHDSVALIIDSIGLKLASLPEDERPESVQVMIVTDGEENSSSRYRASDVKTRIEHQTTKYGWLFTYVGSNQDAITTGGSMGINAALCATYTDNNFSNTLNLVNDKMSKVRCISDYSTKMSMASYSSVERESLVQ